MRIDTESISTLDIAIDGVTYNNPNELIEYLISINNKYSNLSSKQWISILMLATNNLAIGFRNEGSN